MTTIYIREIPEGLFSVGDVSVIFEVDRDIPQDTIRIKGELGTDYGATARDKKKGYSELNTIIGQLAKKGITKVEYVPSSSLQELYSSEGKVFGLGRKDNKSQVFAGPISELQKSLTKKADVSIVEDYASYYRIVEAELTEEERAEIYDLLNGSGWKNINIPQKPNMSDADYGDKIEAYYKSIGDKIKQLATGLRKVIRKGQYKRIIEDYMKEPEMAWIKPFATKWDFSDETSLDASLASIKSEISAKFKGDIAVAEIAWDQERDRISEIMQKVETLIIQTDPRIEQTTRNLKKKKVEYERKRDQKIKKTINQLIRKVIRLKSQLFDDVANAQIEIWKESKNNALTETIYNKLLASYPNYTNYVNTLRLKGVRTASAIEKAKDRKKTKMNSIYRRLYGVDKKTGSGETSNASGFSSILGACETCWKGVMGRNFVSLALVVILVLVIIYVGSLEHSIDWEWHFKDSPDAPINWLVIGGAMILVYATFA